MFEELRKLIFRVDQWSKNYEYEIVEVTDTKISSSLSCKPFPLYIVGIIFFLFYVISFILPNIIPTQMVVNILFPIFLFETTNIFILIISTPITLFLYITLLTWILNKCDFNLLKNIIWKSSLVISLLLSTFFTFCFIFIYFAPEYRIFDIDISYLIFLVIFLGLYFYLESVLEPTVITHLTELIRQRDLKLISEEKFIKIKDLFLSRMDDTDLNEEIKKTIRNILNL